jgi:hypothetical protein
MKHEHSAGEKVLAGGSSNRAMTVHAIFLLSSLFSLNFDR